jgi:hypothetical protein
MNVMKVKVIVPGRYNGLSLRAQMYGAGDVLDTQDWYAAELVASGLVAPLEKAKAAKAPEPEPEQEPEQEPEPELEPAREPDGYETESASIADLKSLKDLKKVAKRAKK